MSIQRCPPLVGEPLDPGDAADLAGVFKALGDPVRLRLLSLIAAHEGGEACVCDITPAFDLAQPTISHHLKVLRSAGLGTWGGRRTWVFYRAEPKAVQQLTEMLDVLADSGSVWA